MADLGGEKGRKKHKKKPPKRERGNSVAPGIDLPAKTDLEKEGALAKGKKNGERRKEGHFETENRKERLGGELH